MSKHADDDDDDDDDGEKCLVTGVKEEEIKSKPKLVFDSFEYDFVQVNSVETKQLKGLKDLKIFPTQTFYLIKKIEVNKCSHARQRLGSQTTKEKKKKGVRLLVVMVIDIESVETKYTMREGIPLVITTRTLFRCSRVEKFISEFRTMVKTLRERVNRLVEKRISREIRNFTDFVYQRIFLKDHEDCTDRWMQNMYSAIIDALMDEMVLFVSSNALGSQFVRQILDDFFGIQYLTESNWTERKLFLTSLNMARAKGPLWNEIYLHNGTSTNVIVGQLPTKWHIRMLHECRNVRSVLSVCESYELEEVDGRCAWHLNGIIQKQISVKDFRGGGGTDSLYEGMKFIEQQLQIGAVYVHCKAGKGRSVLMVMSWLMKHFNSVSSVLDAFHVVMMHRPQINPDTIMTHSKVKEAHMFWLEHVMNISDIMKDGVLFVNENIVLDTDDWIDQAVGAGFFSNDEGGYLHARDKMVKWYVEVVVPFQHGFIHSLSLSFIHLRISQTHVSLATGTEEVPWHKNCIP